MQTSILQTVAVVIWGNAGLHGADLSAFWPSSPLFQFCKSVRFVTLSEKNGSFTETPYAEDPLEWFGQMKRRGVRGFRVLHQVRNDPRISDRMAVGFVGGGGRWMIEAIGGDGADLWEARWALGDRNDPQRRIWNVTYGRTVADRPILEPCNVKEEVLRTHLADVLSEIACFAKVHKLDNFATCFRQALSALDAETPGWPGGMVPVPLDGLPLSSQRLLAASLNAWVFGAMGSWNDLGFQGGEQTLYESLSDRLFQLLNHVVVQAANASFTPTPLPKGGKRKPWWRAIW